MYRTTERASVLTGKRSLHVLAQRVARRHYLLPRLLDMGSESLGRTEHAENGQSPARPVQDWCADADGAVDALAVADRVALAGHLLEFDVEHGGVGDGVGRHRGQPEIGEYSLALVIGEGAVVGANAVVTRDLPAYAIAVGAPARVIRDRRALNGDALNGDALNGDALNGDALN
jgi:hypothetical protein